MGLQVVQQYDQSRMYKTRVDMTTGEPATGKRTRPMQMLLWYPAARGGRPVVYRDYMDTIPTEDEFGRSPAEVGRATQRAIDGYAGARRDALLREVARPMLAVRNARAESGSFPVVIYAPSLSESAMENADLCEYLASQGYVVLSSASLGPRTRAMTTDLEGLEAQAADIAYLIGYASSLPQADTARVAVVGFSWGGLANVLAAAKDDRIQAIVSLDGSVRGTREFVDGGKDAAKYVTPARVAIPMLFVGRRPMTVEELNRAEVDSRYSFMNEMKYADVHIVTLLPMKHMDFSSYSLRMSQDGRFGDYTRDDIALAHSWAMRYARHFLDAYLKKDPAGLAFLDNSPAANKAPPHMMLASARHGSGQIPPTLENFVAALAAEGFDQAIPLYAKFAAQDPAFKLGPKEIYGWGVQLARQNRPAQAREIFRLGTHLNPDAVFMIDGLAEMQAASGQTKEALGTYRRVLALDPKHTDAARYVKEHGGPSGAAL
ncbi:dienelactone hydrolase family protein [Massilia litorea]|uniref:Dienelactone hydrolase family protein n=1 Tax=Massilia litorea TaxID=2769491 RepID=A0A7L9UAK1_9BURK|nr:dienelactone hydrolase family protein [Massilia litorea]